MNDALAWLTFVLAIFPGVLFAQGQSGTSAHVEFPASPASWSVVVSNPKKAIAHDEGTNPEKESTTLARIDTVLDGRVRCDFYTWSDKRVTQIWIYGDYVVMEDRMNHAIYASRKNDAVRPGEQVILDAGTFAWTKEDVQPTPADYHGRNCLLFRKGDAVTGNAVYTDAETFLPVAYVEEGITYEFTFGSTPLPMPKMPEAFLAKLNRLIRANTPPIILNRH